MGVPLRNEGGSEEGPARGFLVSQQFIANGKGLDTDAAKFADEDTDAGFGDHGEVLVDEGSLREHPECAIRVAKSVGGVVKRPNGAAWVFADNAEHADA